CDLREPLCQVVVPAAAQLHLALADVGERAIAVPFRLEQPVRSLRQTGAEGREHRLVAACGPTRWRRRLLPLADDQPVLLLAGELRWNQRPGPVELVAAQPYGQTAVLLLFYQLVGAVVPDLDRAGAILAFRDLPLEGGVVQRMVLDVDGEVLRAGLERHALRHRPARQHAVALQPEVVVQPPGIVA